VPGALHEGLLERGGGAQPMLWLELEEPPQQLVEVAQLSAPAQRLTARVGP